MKSIRMITVGNKRTGYAMLSQEAVTMDKVALYFNRDMDVFLFDREKAMSYMEELGENGDFFKLGNSPYIVIYPGDLAVHTDGADYLLGDCMLMKCGKGPQCMTEEETKETAKEFSSRFAILKVGSYDLPAFRIG